MSIKSLLAPDRLQAFDRIRSLLHQAGPLGDRAVVIIPAAGRGERSGLEIPKQYHRLAGKTLLTRSIRAASELSAAALVLVVLSPEDAHYPDSDLASFLTDLEHVVLAPIGGASRRDSVMAGLLLLTEAIGSQEERPWILVHDAARPGLSRDSLLRLWNDVRANDSGEPFFGGILAIPIADTVKRSERGAGSQASVARRCCASTART